MPTLLARLQSLRVYVLGGLIPALTGTLAIGMGTYLCIHRQHFFAHATHTEGTVVGKSSDRVFKPGGGSSPHHKPIFQFADAAGKTWRVTDQSSDYTLNPAPVGQSCPVLYDPDNPAEAQLELPHTWWNRMGPGPLFAVFGAVLASVGIWVLRRYRPWPAPGPLPGRDPAILSSPWIS